MGKMHKEEHRLNDHSISVLQKQVEWLSGFTGIELPSFGIGSGLSYSDFEKMCEKMGLVTNILDLIDRLEKRVDELEKANNAMQLGVKEGNKCDQS